MNRTLGIILTGAVRLLALLAVIVVIAYWIGQL